MHGYTCVRCCQGVGGVRCHSPSPLSLAEPWPPLQDAGGGYSGLFSTSDLSDGMEAGKRKTMENIYKSFFPAWCSGLCWGPSRVGTPFSSRPLDPT